MMLKTSISFFLWSPQETSLLVLRKRRAIEAFILNMVLWREVLSFVDWFTAVHFMETSALPAMRGIRFLLRSQHGQCPITFGIQRSY
jgi:hypothetical protein